MTKKTALQEFLEQIVLKKVEGSVYILPAITDIQIEEGLEKEREQIELAYMGAVCSIYELDVCPIDEQDAASCYYEAQYIHGK